MTFVDIASILVPPRGVPDTEDLEPLIASIRDTGLQVPILLDEEGFLIDGRRRMGAMCSLGHTTIKVVVASTQADMLRHLSLTRVHGVHEREWLRTRRAYEIYLAYNKLSGKARSLAYREGDIKGARFGSRYEVVKLFQLRSDAEVQAYVSNYKLLYKGAIGATEAIRRYETGEVGAYGAQAMLRLQRDRKGTINNFTEQRAFLQQIRISMEALGRSLLEFGRLNPRIPKEEVDEYLDSLQRNRATITRFIRALAKENTAR